MRKHDPRSVPARRSGVPGARSDVAAEGEWRRQAFLTEHAPVGIVHIGTDGSFLYLNEKFKELFGWTLAEIPTQAAWREKAYPDPAYRKEVMRSWVDDNNGLKAGQKRARTLKIRCKDGGEKTVTIISAIFDSGEAMMACTDVTEQVRLEEQLRFSALHDGLTQLPNRVLLLDRLGHILERNKGRQPIPFAVVYLDLDRFKGINDGLGHAAGDAILVEISRRVSAALRPGDTVARLGADEFVVLLEDAADSRAARSAAGRLLKAVEQPLDLAVNRPAYVTASIGLAMGTQGTMSAEDFLRDAHTAMVQAKSLGGNRAVVFGGSMHRRAVARLDVEMDLRKALKSNEFVLHYQPIVSLATRETFGFEALIRWRHPQRGLLLPKTFIPVAEEAGLISPLGQWVLRDACRQSAAWARSGTPAPAVISVNVSGHQVAEAGFETLVRRILDETGLPPGSLILELTESVLMVSGHQARAMLMRLRSLGVRIFMDDFGTGYSSLSSLQSLPLDAIKIDRSFVTGGDHGGSGEAILGGILKMARALDLLVVVEGVETAGQADKLKAFGCGYAQGFYFSAAVPAQDVGKLMAPAAQLPVLPALFP